MGYKTMKYLILIFLLCSCGEKKEGECLKPSDGQSYAIDLCSSHLGLKSYEITEGSNIEFECNDGSFIMIKNYYLP